MPISVTIRRAPDKVVKSIRARAKQHHRSLQGELLAILEEAAAAPPALSLKQALADIRASGLSTPNDSTRMIREDRDHR